MADERPKSAGIFLRYCGNSRVPPRRTAYLVFLISQGTNPQEGSKLAHSEKDNRRFPKKPGGFDTPGRDHLQLYDAEKPEDRRAADPALHRSPHWFKHLELPLTGLEHGPLPGFHPVNSAGCKQGRASAVPK